MKIIGYWPRKFVVILVTVIMIMTITTMTVVILHKLIVVTNQIRVKTIKLNTP